MLGHAGTYCIGADTHSINYATTMAKVDVFTGQNGFEHPFSSLCMNHLYGVQRIPHIFINYEFVRVVVNLEMKGYRYLRRSKHQKKHKR